MYRGQAFVHWTMAIEDRRTGWLDAAFHAQWRELLLHTGARYHLICPTYVLIPDHWHMLWIGLSEEFDQRSASKFFREHTGELLTKRGFALQKQAYDHVLREDDRTHDAFAKVAQHILCNPERAKLTADWQAYPYSGALITGYPSLDPRHPDYWEKFWKIHERLTSEA
jgi:putative transposase